MNIEEFKQSVIPREIRVDDTDRLEEGMVLPTPTGPLMIMVILDEMALGVIDIDEMVH
jgi:hypothetical protein